MDTLLCGTALEIKHWPEPEQIFFTGIVAGFRLGTNKQKQLVRLIEDLKQKEHIGLEAIWKNCGLQGADPADINFEKIHRQLSEKRFPVLSEHHKNWEKLRESLHLPSDIKLQIPRFFDSDSLTVSFSAASPVDFKDKVNQLLEASRKKELESIYSLL